MKRFTISFEVDQPTLDIVVPLLSGEISNMKIDEIKPIIKPPSGWLKKNEHIVADILAEMQDGKRYHYLDDIFHNIITVRHEVGSVPNVISHMTREGMLIRVGRGHYVKATTHEDTGGRDLRRATQARPRHA